MKTMIDLVLRLLIGLGLTAFGLHKFIGFIPRPIYPVPPRISWAPSLAPAI